MKAHIRPLLRLAALPLSLLALAAAAQAGNPAPGWNEAVNGDLSGNNLLPTFVTLASGQTTVSGLTGRAVPGGPVDRDYFTITVPAGFVLSSLTVLPGTEVLVEVGFIGMMSGSSFTVPPDAQSAAGMLGFRLYSENDIGNDILEPMGLFPELGASGFSTPLPAGSYSFWVQETGVGVARYGFGFGVTPVPEPATALTLLAGLGLLAGALRRR